MKTSFASADASKDTMMAVPNMMLQCWPHNANNDGDITITIYITDTFKIDKKSSTDRPFCFCWCHQLYGDSNTSDNNMVPPMTATACWLSTYFSHQNQMGSYQLTSLCFSQHLQLSLMLLITSWCWCCSASNDTDDIPTVNIGPTLKSDKHLLIESPSFRCHWQLYCNVDASYDGNLIWIIYMVTYETCTSNYQL